MGTIYIRTPDKHLSLSNDNIIISDKNGKERIPLNLVDGIVIEGEISLTSPKLYAN